MILPADQVRRIQRGERTTIRIPVDTRLLATPLRPATRHQSRPYRPARGELLPIQHTIQRPGPDGGPTKNGWETVCHAQITEVDRGPLGTPNHAQANAEGYETAGEFIQAWVRRHDREWLDRQVRHLIEAGVPEHEANDTKDEWALIRYRDRWESRETWVITIEVEHDINQHLESAATAKSEHGYTIGQDVLDAGVVPPVQQLRQRWTRKSARRHLEAISENASPEERSRRARALARRVRELALQDPILTRKIEELVRDAEKKAA